MKNLILIFATCFTGLVSFGQVSGNLNHSQASGNKNLNYIIPQHFADQNINVQFSTTNNNSSNDLVVSVKGLSNVKADSYVAIFTISQVGKTAEEANKLLDTRLQEVETKLSSIGGTQVFIDMLSFVPLYEYETEKKIFSKRTYNEIPKGFELKKSIHIRYKQHEILNTIIAACAGAEVYDLVRVDYFSDDMATIKKELMARSQYILNDKIAFYGTILGDDLNTSEKQMVDGFILKYPVEAYKSYQAYSSTSLNLNKPANVTQAPKSTSMYYQPIMDKEFDFVINPTIVEPVIQVMYEIKVRFERDKPEELNKETQKEYLLVTPNGDIRNLNLQ